MCEVTEKWFEEGQTEGQKEGRKKGRTEGELKAKKKTALNLADMGIAPEKIAKAVEVSVATVKQWLDGAVVAR